MRRTLFLLIIGLGGASILIALGLWQVQRLAWKQAIISDINARIAAAPVDLPQAIDATADAYLPVTVSGLLDDEEIHVLVSKKDVGAGYRIITPLELNDGRASVTGNLQWPQETDGFTPAPDLAENIWFARDVPAMAQKLQTLPILLVARFSTPADNDISPLPVDTSRIPNDHLQYAITWFSLAAIWLGMSLFFLRRRRAPKAES